MGTAVVITNSFKKRIALFVFSFIHILFSINISADEVSSEEKAWLKEHQEIIFVSQSNYPPFEFLDMENNSTGMSIELIRWIATEFGFRVRFRAMSFQEAQKAVLNGEADAITSLFYSEKRDEKYDFTTMTWEVPALIFVKSERPDIRTLQDLNGKRVAMQRGDYAGEFLEQEGIQYTIVPTDTFEEAVELVIAGLADAVVGDKPIVLYYLFSNGVLDKVKSLEAPLYIGKNSIAVKEGDIILQSILNKGLKRAMESGVIEKIDKKWMGITYSQSSDWFDKNRSYIGGGLGILTLLFILVALWNLNLRHTVNKKTAELRFNQFHLQSILNSIPDLMWLKDKDGIYRNCNRRFERFIGLDEEQIIGKSDYDFFETEMADNFSRYDQSAIDEGLSVHETELIYKDDGHTENVEIILSSIYDVQKNFIGILGIAHDITERVLAENKKKENELYLDAIIENIPLMIFVKDAENLKFLRFNRAAEKLMGFSKEEMIGKCDHDFFPEEEADFFTNKDREVLSSGTILDIPEEPILTHSGEEKLLHTRKISINNSKGKPQYLLGISEDITEQKQIETLTYIQRDLGVALGAVSRMDKALSLCLDAVITIPGIDCGGIYSVDSDNRTMTLVEHRELPDKFIEETSFFEEESLQYRLVTKGTPLYTTYPLILDSMDLDEKEKEVRLQSRIKALAIYPVLYNGAPVAVVNAASRHMDEFSPYSRLSLEAIASQMAEALARISTDIALKNSQQNFQTLFDNIKDFIFILDEEGRINYWNPVVEIRLGYGSEELMKMNVLDLHPPEQRREAQEVVGEMLQGKRHTCPISLYTKTHKLIPVETHVTKGHWNGKPALFGVSRDISEMKKSQKRMSKALQEKEILLKEIHHRVKNNLQVVSSLLSLQSETTSDPKALAAFTEAESKVRSMALVHEILYKSEHLDRIPLQTYLDNLVENLRILYIGRDVHIDIKAEKVEIQLDQAITCGLIFTELISNSLKHAFTIKSQGNILITVVSLDDGSFRAVISDDGCGLSDNFDLQELKSLGIRLVTDLVEDQLEGTWALDGQNGTVWTIIWKGE